VRLFISICICFALLAAAPTPPPTPPWPQHRLAAATPEPAQPLETPEPTAEPASAPTLELGYWARQFDKWPLTVASILAGAFVNIIVLPFVLSRLRARKRALEITGMKGRDLRRFVPVKVHIEFSDTMNPRTLPESIPQDRQSKLDLQPWWKLRKIAWKGEYKKRDFSAVVLFAEAGYGKSILMERLYYFLERKRQRWKLLDSIRKDVVPVIEFARCHSLTQQELKTLVAKKAGAAETENNRRILLLDALDELPGNLTPDFLRDLFAAKSRYTTLIISSRKDAVIQDGRIFGVPTYREGSRAGVVYPLKAWMPVVDTETVDREDLRRTLKICKRNFVLSDGIPTEIPAGKLKDSNEGANKKEETPLRKELEQPKETKQKKAPKAIRRALRIYRDARTWVQGNRRFRRERRRIIGLLRGWLEEVITEQETMKERKAPLFWYEPFFAANAHVLQEEDDTTIAFEEADIKRRIVHKRINTQCHKPGSSGPAKNIVVLDTLIDIAKKLKHAPPVSGVKRMVKARPRYERMYRGRVDVKAESLMADIRTFLVGQRGAALDVADAKTSGGKPLEAERSESFEEYKFFEYFASPSSGTRWEEEEQKKKDAEATAGKAEENANQEAVPDAAWQQAYSRLSGYDPKNKYTSLKKISESLDVLQNFGGIAWQALDVEEVEEAGEKKRRVLLISREILWREAFNKEDKPVNWATCTLRANLVEWLEDKFSTAEKDRINRGAPVATPKPKGMEESITAAHMDAERKEIHDGIFLLSLDELVKHFGDSGKLDGGGSVWFTDDFDERRIALHKDTKKPGWWWLRSSGAGPGRAACVDDDGGVSVDGHSVNNPGGGVRPALWLNL